MHHLLIQLQQMLVEEKSQVQLQINEQQQQITELSRQEMQWIHEGKKAQTEIQHLQSKVCKLKKKSQEVLDTVGTNLEKIVDEPLQMKMLSLQSIAATKATISATLSEQQAFQDHLHLTVAVVISTCQANCLEPENAMNPQKIIKEDIDFHLPLLQDETGFEVGGDVERPSRALHQALGRPMSARQLAD